MSIFDIFRWGRKATDPLTVWSDMLRAGRTSKSGATVNLDNALKVATLFACLRVLSQGCAQVPFKLFRETTVDGLKNIEAAREHRHYDLVATKPNDWQTSFEFREQLVIHAGLGNAYVWKSLVIGGKVAEMIILDPGRMEVMHPNEFAAPVYKYTLKDGKVVLFDAQTIWHVRGPSWSGFAGMDILNMAREALGLSIATEDSHAKLHAKGVRPSGTYSVDGSLSPQQYADLKKWIMAEMAGSDNAGAPMILDRGAKWLTSAMTGIDAQHLETRNYQGAEICRFMGVLPSKVGFTDKAATYASAEQFAIQHVVDSLGPWYARIEQSADINLLTQAERAQGYYFKFIAAGLLRGALKDQGEYFSRALGSGGSPAWMTQDEVRMLTELNPKGGSASDLPQSSAQVSAQAAKSIGEQHSTEYKALESKLADIGKAAPSINVTLNQEPVSVSLSSPPVTVEGADIKVNVPEFPEQKAANIQIDVHVPEGPVPKVENVVNVPTLDQPVINFEATMPAVNVNLPMRRSESKTSIVRDSDGNIVNSTTITSERDA